MSTSGDETTTQVTRHVPSQLIFSHFLVITVSLTRPQLSNTRLNSGILSTFPWHTDVILQDFQTVITDPEHVVLSDTLVSFEKELEEAVTPVAADFVQALALVQPENRIFQKKPLNKRVAGESIAVVCAYRLLDAIYDVEKEDSTYPRPIHAKSGTAGLRPNSTNWANMDKWVENLHTTKLNLANLEKFRTTSTDTTTPSNVQASLFRDLIQFHEMKAGSQILYNVQLAALHISFMFKAPKDKLAIPNFPESEADISEEWNLQPLEKEFLRRLIQDNDTAKIRHPLYGALLFSPLYLLSGQKVMSNAWKQGNMLLLSKALGNEKPEILVRIERALWASLLSIASGKAKTYPALQKFLSVVPWDDLAMISDVDRKFFQDELVRPNLSALLSIENESNVDAAWPLSDLRPVPVVLAPPDDTEPGDAMAVDKELVPGAGPAPPSGAAPSGEKPVDKELVPGAGPVPPSGAAPSGEKPAQKKRGKRASRKVTSSKTVSVPKRKDQKVTRTAYVPFQDIGDRTFLQPIQVPVFEEGDVTFDIHTPRTLVHSGPKKTFKISGTQFEWNATFHSIPDAEKFSRYHKYTEECYVDGQPRYLSSPDTSILQVVPYQRYQGMSVREIQRLMADKHIVITGYPTTELSFDEEGLQVLKSLDAPTDIQDQSIVPKHDLNEQLVVGNLDQILQCSRNPKGPIVNGLSFPLPYGAIEKSGISSDFEAWVLTEDKNNEAAIYPASHMRWGLCSTSGARHWNHVDADGLGTFVDVRCGGKWWLLFQLKKGPHVCTVRDFTVSYEPDKPPKMFHVEAVYLEPGTRLIMRPNTLHAVFTVKNTIVTGGHFYSCSNLRDTMSGLIHTCVIDNVITNTEHPEARMLLWRMMQMLYKYYVHVSEDKRHRATHLPDLTRSEDLFNVLSLCNYCILGNVLDRRTYNLPNGCTPQHNLMHDLNSLSPVDRHNFMYFRGLAINLVQWIDCHYVAVKEDNPDLDDDVGIETIAKDYLNLQARGLIYYKVRATQAKLDGIPNCDITNIHRQMMLLFTKPIFGMDATFLNQPMTLEANLACDPSVYRIGRMLEPGEFAEFDPTTLGTTLGDELFLTGSKNGFPLDSSDEDAEGEDEVEEDEVEDEEDGDDYRDD